MTLDVYRGRKTTIQPNQPAAVYNKPYSPGRRVISLDFLLQARRVQELFHGRFTEGDTTKLLVANAWDVHRAVNFCLEGNELNYIICELRISVI